MTVMTVDPFTTVAESSNEFVRQVSLKKRTIKEKFISRSRAFDRSQPSSQSVEQRLIGKPIGTYIAFESPENDGILISWINESRNLAQVEVKVSDYGLELRKAMPKGKYFGNLQELVKMYSELFSTPLLVLEARSRVCYQKRVTRLSWELDLSKVLKFGISVRSLHNSR
ncbi:MAG: hypothetical protein ACI9S8_002021 [Chlamydiales bacterium]|jgi:hypothetical protein